MPSLPEASSYRATWLETTNSKHGHGGKAGILAPACGHRLSVNTSKCARTLPPSSCYPLRMLTLRRGVVGVVTVLLVSAPVPLPVSEEE